MTIYSESSYQLNLLVKEDGGHYSVACSAPGMEQETFHVSADDLKKISERSVLADSFFTHPDPKRFMNDFIDIGSALHRLFLEPFTGLDAFTSDAVSQNSPVLINIQSLDHKISRLPWELLYSPVHQFMAACPRFQIIRTAGDGT